VRNVGVTCVGGEVNAEPFGASDSGALAKSCTGWQETGKFKSCQQSHSQIAGIADLALHGRCKTKTRSGKIA
jgi:hypothetical protein